MKNKTILLLLLIFSANITFAQETNKISITERSDYRVYKNGIYTGLTNSETKSYIVQRASTDNKLNYFGEVFVLRKTKHDRREVAKTIDSVLKIEYFFDLDKPVENPYQPQIFTKDEAYPILRNFPILPSKNFQRKDIGRRWHGKSTIVVKPAPEKSSTRIPVFVEFEYKGMNEYNGKKVHYVKAVFGVRYKGTDENGDCDLIRSQGKRKADIYLDEKLRPIFIREEINEDFFYKDAIQIKNKGFLLHFYKYTDSYTDSYICDKKIIPFAPLVSYASEKELERLEKKELEDKEPTKPDKIKTKKAKLKNSDKTKIIKIKPTKNFNVKQTECGTVLNLKNLNFIANKAVLLKGEGAKLDEIAKALKTTEAEFFLVEGHTADIGNYKEQKQLSLDRSRIIANELIKRGIPATKVIISGAGGTKPIASNESKEGRAKNRRVEITIF